MPGETNEGCSRENSVCLEEVVLGIKIHADISSGGAGRFK